MKKLKKFLILFVPATALLITGIVLGRVSKESEIRNNIRQDAQAISYSWNQCESRVISRSVGIH
ncbi:hypothetical protein EV682_109106 [Iodobacter fluviatilis]|uniref:Uncharacterized protein n=1 Tax=Iodobacter fluviatilis TaxID=537 RepID=A0ABY2C6W4_9NEIS|nr:hypothetical protein EV682_109106 [Iodobacter fluviatilis]